MLTHDFIGGRLFRVSCMPPAPTASGHGTVYVIEDGIGIKVGFTSGSVAQRIGELQPGNPRRITVIAEVGNATLELEALLHVRLNEWNVSGEWFARSPLTAQAAGAGGFRKWLCELAGGDSWPIAIHPPYSG